MTLKHTENDQEYAQQQQQQNNNNKTTTTATTTTMYSVHSKTSGVRSDSWTI
jgi:hypothetical protein